MRQNIKCAYIELRGLQGAADRVMEIFRNHGLVVGRTIAQMVFFEVGETLQDYPTIGKYQTTADVIKLKKDWKPESMLPRLWRDASK